MYVLSGSKEEGYKVPGVTTLRGSGIKACILRAVFQNEENGRGSILKRGSLYNYSIPLIKNGFVAPALVRNGQHLFAGHNRTTIFVCFQTNWVKRYQRNLHPDKSAIMYRLCDDHDRN